MLAYYQKLLAIKIAENNEALGSSSLLRDACDYALTNGGKRIRPALVLMIADALGKQRDATQAALAIEYFHTASLVADDLPCMDDDDARRNKPSVHKVYGEAAALLVSYALIAAGYACIEKGTKKLPNGDRVCALALENATYNTGLHGATGGQFLDLYPPNLEETTLREIIHKKTVSLFEIAFVFGWLYGGGDPRQLFLVKCAAAHFGMAFQIADDLGDVEQDAENGRVVNYANLYGHARALEIVQEELELYKQALKALNLHAPALYDVADELITLPLQQQLRP